MAKKTTAAAAPEKKAAAKKTTAKTTSPKSTAEKTDATTEKPELQAGSNETTPPATTEQNENNGGQSPEETEKSGNSGIPQDNQIKRPIAIVIPYLHASAVRNELKFALRAWEKNFDEPFVVVIIGDKPEFLNDQVLHIPALEKGANPQIDVATKLMQAIASDLVTEDFILTNDDIYPVNPITLAELQVLRISGELGAAKLNAGEGYMKKLMRTKELLQMAERPALDYATHLPVIYNKEKLAAVIEEFEADKEGLLISSLYFNSYVGEQEPVLTKGGADADHVVYVYRSNPRMDVVQDGFENRKFVNHNSEGYKAVAPLLLERFPEKSKFEI